MLTPKKGDVVWINGWGGVMGEFVSLRGDTLTLKFPSARWVWGDINPREFYPIKEDIQILSPLEVLERMDKIFAARLTGLQSSLISDVKEIIRQTEI